MKKILIVEDDILIAEIERDYLEAERFETSICQNGQEGLKMALEEDYDLIILDVMLPGISGFSICREIRREKDVAIIMVTGAWSGRLYCKAFQSWRIGSKGKSSYKYPRVVKKQKWKWTGKEL